MTLEWMGRYRPLIEAYIKAANHYAQTYKTPVFKSGQAALSAANIQVLEYILEDEAGELSMQQQAARLGITRGAFSKTVTKLETLGLVEKRHPANNKKEYRLALTPLGQQTYGDYVEVVYKRLFARLFALAEGIPERYIQPLTEIFKTIAQ